MIEHTRLEPFTPTAVLEGGTSPIAQARFSSRRSTSDEQRAEAVRHAAAWMAEHRIWTVDLEVRWTRSEPTILTVSGHGETLGGRTVPAVDRVRERDLAGRAIELTTPERFVVLEREVAELYDEGLD